MYICELYSVFCKLQSCAEQRLVKSRQQFYMNPYIAISETSVHLLEQRLLQTISFACDNFCLNFNLFCKQCCESVRNVLEKVSIESDIQSFINKASTGSEKPGKFTFLSLLFVLLAYASHS